MARAVQYKLVAAIAATACIGTGFDQARKTNVLLLKVHLQEQEVVTNPVLVVGTRDKPLIRWQWGTYLAAVPRGEY